MPEETAPFRALDIDRVRSALAGSAFADVRYVAVTGSTNDDATPRLAERESAGATLVAEEQTAGRGRKAGRAWIAPPGTALLFTTILPAPLPVGDVWAVPFWVALSVADGIERACGVRIALRWPNDGFVDGRKVAGILCVSRVAGAQAHVACGVGINVHRPAPAAIAAIDPAPSFLSDVAPAVTREDVLAAVLGSFERGAVTLAYPGAIARAYERRAGLPGERYRVRLDADGEELEGTARGLDADGALRLEVDGVERTIALADVRRL